MKYLPQDTLAYFNAAPQNHLYDVSVFPTQVFSAATVKYRESCGEAAPNKQAITFYALFHCASLIRKQFTVHESLPDWARSVMQQYTTEAMAQGQRMLHYVLSITTREMRHLKVNSLQSSFWGEMEAKFGPVAVAFIKNLASDGDEFVAVGKYMDTPPDTTIGQYMGALAYAFHKAGKNGSNGWHGSFGGDPWGDVTDAALAFLTGTTSLELFVDTGFTLAHNGGPIFNKGMMYSMYNLTPFMAILDVQRSGQIPELILDPENYHVDKPSEIISMITTVQAACPKAFKGYVDWTVVNAAMPVGKKSTYALFESKQLQKHPKKVEPVVPVVKKVAGKKVTVVGQYQVSPGKYLETYVRDKG